LIVDDNGIMRRGIRTLLQTRPDLLVVGEAASGREALKVALDANPDIAILEYTLPELNGRDLTLELKRALPQTRVLIYTMHQREEMILDVLQAGASGVLFKTDTEKDFLAAIDALSVNRTYFSGAISETLIGQNGDKRRRPTSRSLTHREREIVQLVAEGNRNKQVARLLSLSIKTVETHRSQAMEKIQAHSTADVVRYAVRNNMIAR
jgi:DNA-binding NarL/FixJ family response regulator